MKRRIFLITLLLISAGILTAGPLVPRLVPQRVIAGRTARYVVELPGKPDSRQVKLPRIKNLHWGGVSTEYRSINFKTSCRMVFSLAVTEKGRYTIPGWSLRCGGKDLPVAPVSFEAVAGNDASAPQGMSYREAFSGEILLTEKKKVFYVGEEIPVAVRLQLLAAAGARVSYPDLQPSAGVIFHYYPAAHGQRIPFDQPLESTVERDGRVFQEIIFPAAFRVTRPAVLTMNGKVELQVPEQIRRPSGWDDDEDDFFGGSMMRRMMSFGSMTRHQPHTVLLAPLKNLEIRAVPPCPEGLLNTGLVGAWRGTCRADRQELKVGDALTVTLTLTGQGAVELWRSPTLEIPEFRSYPPEMKKSASPDGAAVLTIRYALIALKEGEFKANARFAFFDPAASSYRTIPFVWQGRVVKSDRPQIEEAAVETRLPDPPAGPVTPLPQDEPFYQKADVGDGVALPWFRNAWPKMALLLAAGGVIALCSLGWSYRQKRRMDADTVRQRQLSMSGKKFLKMLTAARDEKDFFRLVREEGMSLLIDAQGLPPGTAWEEATANISDEEVKKILRAAGVSAFCPGAAETALTADERKKVFRFFRKMVIVLAFFSLTLLHGEEMPLNRAYDRGDYPAAAKYYRSLMKKDEASANLWYNYGGAMIQLKRYPEARYALLKAHLLSPRDTETLENLNFVNRKLRLEETGRASSPQLWFSYCRDRLRPDQYLILLAFWTALGAVAVSLPWARRWKAWSGAIVLLLWLGTAGLLRSGMTGPYDVRNAVVVVPQLELCALPVSVGARVTATIPGGADAAIEETRGEWVHLRVNGRTGWARKNGVKALFPNGLW